MSCKPPPLARGRGRRAQQGALWENLTTRPSCGILRLLGYPSAAVSATDEADQPQENTTRPSERSATVPRLVPAPVPAAAPPSPLRLCCLVWVWSMRDGMGHVQAKAWAMRAFSGWLLSGHSPQSPPPLTGLPPRCLCQPWLPTGHGMERPHAHANRR